MCIFVKGCLTFELEYILYSVTSSINAGVNQTFSVPLLDTMIHLVLNEALLFNIFHEHCTKLCNVTFFFFMNTSLIPWVIQATIAG